jgi:hypothetical protein
LKNPTPWAQYLKLLVELGWLEKIVNELPSRTPPLMKKYTGYRITEAGRTFLSAFPRRDDDELQEGEDVVGISSETYSVAYTRLLVRAICLERSSILVRSKILSPESS